VVGEASDGFETVERVVSLHPDVAVLDIAMPGQDGIRAARQIHQRAPAVKIVMLTMHDAPELLYQALEAGASGYVSKREAERELVDAIRQACRGGGFAGSAATRELALAHQAEEARAGALWLVEELTSREEEILRLLAHGYTNSDVAGELMLSVKTVETHRHHILSKLGLHSRAELFRYACTRGLVAAGAA
jgi:two-component system response regulator NreC